MRRRRPEKRTVLPDPVYGNYMVAKFVNYIMVRGKKGVAEKIFYGAMDQVKNRTKSDGLKIFEKETNQNVELIDLQTIRPLDKNSIIESVKKTNRLLIVEESWPFASVGSEIVNIVQKEAFDYLDSPILKINSADVPMPYSSFLEKQYLPQVEDIVLAAKEVCYI